MNSRLLGENHIVCFTVCQENKGVEEDNILSTDLTRIKMSDDAVNGRGKSTFSVIASVVVDERLKYPEVVPSASFLRPSM